MRNFYVILAVVMLAGFASLDANAQALKVVSASGGYAEGSNYSISWTLGEPAIVTATSANNHVTQGFQQPDLAVLSVFEHNDLQISVYPNPARDIINVETDENSTLTIYDMQGKIVDVIQINNLLTQIDVSYLMRGTYNLIFTAGAESSKRIKIVVL